MQVFTRVLIQLTHVHVNPFQLGDPRAAIFKVVRFQEHPEVPDTMSSEAKNFCER